MVATKEDSTPSQLETAPVPTDLQTTLKQDQSSHPPKQALKVAPAITKTAKARHRPPPPTPELTDSLDYAAYAQFDKLDFTKEANLNSATLQAVTEASAAAKKQSLLVAQTFTNQLNASQQFEPNPAHILPSPSVRAKLNTFRRNSNHSMELHDATGALLQSYAVNPDDSSQPLQQQPQHEHDQHHLQPDTLQQPKQEPSTQPSSQQVPSQSQPAQLSQSQTQQAAAATPASSSAQPTTSAPIANPANAQQAAQPAPPKKPARMPGTKQCPSCQKTIAAAVAKCPKCGHVFREKKEKVKRSGKRGKKNCPKCSFENPSACSSCKQCKYVFRLKLMDRFKAMRPRQPSDSAAAAAAAAAHAAANMAHGSTVVSAVATVPLPAGVATFPNQIAQQVHPAHVSVMPPTMPAQHTMAIHHNTHNVHTAGMPQIHPMPPHQTHPQL